MKRLLAKLSLAALLSATSPVRAQPEPFPGSERVEASAEETTSSAESASDSTARSAPLEPITVTPSFAGKASIPDDEPIELSLSRPLDRPREARIAVVFGSTDLSDLFSAEALVLRLNPKLTSLPAGDQEMLVFLCTAEREWLEIGRFPVRVLGRLGFERAALQPKVDVSLSGQIAERHFPEEPAPPRETFQDVTTAVSLNTDHQRRGFNLKSQVNLVGATNQQQALRFGQDGEEAPQVDLSNYVVSVQQGPLIGSLGHVTVTGGNRHLFGSLASRGMSLAAKLGQRMDFTLSALSGTSVVGFDNFAGLENSEHRILAGTLGLEILQRSGGLRLETTVLDGRLQPQFGFNQGNVNDSEKNRALGLRLLGSLPSQRLRLEAGFTRSEFTNPEDPFLDQGFDVVPVEQETRNARYVDLNADLLQGVRLGTTRTASLSVALRHERVDPLFRSVVAQAGANQAVTNAVAADRQADQIELQATIADLSVQAVHARLEDNLDEIPSILKTRTRRNFLGLGIPLAQLLAQGEKPSPFLPSLSYSIDRTHQFGVSTPVNGEFDEASEVPDQVSTSQNASADWRFSRVGLRYALSHSNQDNRQPEREDSDFTTLTNSSTLSLTPVQSVNVNLDLSLERSENKELGDVNRTRRLGLSAFWSPLSNLSLSLQASHSLTQNDAETNRNESFQLSGSSSLGIQLFQKVRTQLSLGVNHSRNESLDSVFGFASETELTTVNTGISLSFF